MTANNFIIANSVNIIGTDASGKSSNPENKTFIGGNGGLEADDNWGYYYPTQNQGTTSQMRMIDRSFLKLRDINLSYALPLHLASKVGASSASLGVYGRNFLLWTPKNNVYVDPEATNLGNDLNGELGEFSTGPLSKSYGFILKVVF